MDRVVENCRKLYQETFTKLYVAMMDLREIMQLIFSKKGENYPISFSGYDYDLERFSPDCKEWQFELRFQLKWLQRFYSVKGDINSYNLCHWFAPEVELLRGLEYDIINPSYTGGLGGGDKEIIEDILERYNEEDSRMNIFIEELPRILNDLKDYSKTL